MKVLVHACQTGGCWVGSSLLWSLAGGGGRGGCNAENISEDKFARLWARHIIIDALGILGSLTISLFEDSAFHYHFKEN